MLLKYFWIMLFVSVAYILYFNNYFTHIRKNFLRHYNENFNVDKYSSSEQTQEKEEILFTTSTLRKYKNLDDGLYLSILGQVFDVSSGAKHYGPSETYHIFTGLDGSAAFITGDFTDDGLTDDVSMLTNKQIQSLINWVEFYRKTYPYKGKLIGRYYNKDGSPTIERFKLEEKLQMAKKSDATEEEMKLKFPPCNAEWDEKTGTRVWCTKNSGGIARNWIGVPRMLYESPSSKQYRCACIKLDSKEYDEYNGILRVFDGCKETSSTCNIKKNST